MMNEHVHDDMFLGSLDEEMMTIASNLQDVGSKRSDMADIDTSLFEDEKDWKDLMEVKEEEAWRNQEIANAYRDLQVGTTGGIAEPESGIFLVDPAGYDYQPIDEDALVNPIAVSGYGQVGIYEQAAMSDVSDPPTLQKTNRRKVSLVARNVMDDAAAHAVVATQSSSQAGPLQQKRVAAAAATKEKRGGRAKKPKMHQLDPIAHPEAKGSIYSKQNRDKKKIELAAEKQKSANLEEKNRNLEEENRIFRYKFQTLKDVFSQFFTESAMDTLLGEGFFPDPTNSTSNNANVC